MANGIKKKSEIIEEAWRFRTGGIPGRHRALSPVKIKKSPTARPPIIPPAIKQAARRIDIELGRLAGQWSIPAIGREITSIKKRQKQEAGILKGRVGTKQWDDLMRALRGK